MVVHSRNLAAETEAEVLELLPLLTGLFFFLTQHRCAYLRMAPPTVGWNLLHQLAIIRYPMDGMLTGRSDGGNSTADISFQVCQLTGKMSSTRISLPVEFRAFEEYVPRI